ncbi:Dynein heavy chain family protein [Tritrichomonas foetus]|uniref:Dynein heavy chain family protein n=1 Tax=Tritrichomonas foetus TaxID=1144522 RepID=A0A1J4JQ23_9EUKA|nr:Dynein heavy chain family protein [Tritrichomonas foetus]|eukprot:OHT01147.1 Dynein heavy chain family protein [Tritrichomonas foetus]
MNISILYKKLVIHFVEFPRFFMKKRQIEDVFEDSEFMNQKVRPSIKKSSFAPPGFNPERELYNPPSLEANISTFNVVSPGSGTGDAILQEHNPCLLAMAKRAKSTIRPKVKSSIGHQSIAQGMTSYLTKKPLSDLKEPTTDYFEMKKKKEELDKMSLAFDEDPIAYFSKRKDGRGHLFIYLKYAKERNDPNFSPYELEKVPFSEVGKDYYTMSASGVTHIEENGNTETFTLDKWAKDESAYKSIRKLRTFRLYFLWKPYRVWKNFVQQMHYQETRSILLREPLLYNVYLSKASIAVSKLMVKSDSIINSFILAFYTSKKYTPAEFIFISESNIDKLKTKYKNLIEKAAGVVESLFSSISDPKLLKVKDSEFREIKRKNPNIQQLMILEQKKDKERINRTTKMETEVNAMTDFLRMLDYLLLENLRENCYKSWKFARNVISSDVSAVFTIEVSFSDDGDIKFTPSKEEMLELIDKTLNDALITLETLPRLLKMPSLRVILREGGVDITKLFNEGPTLGDMLATSPTVKDSTDNMKEVIASSYDNAYKYSQTLISFFPLYKLGKTWNVKNYFKKRNGEPYEGTGRFSDERDPNETKDNFLINSQLEPVVDFEAAERVISQLRGEVQKVDDIRFGIVRGPLYIDSKGLKAELTPITSRSLKALEAAFADMIFSKITLLNNAFQSFTAIMKQDPTSLDLYVDFSENVQKTTNFLPQITTEIHCIDEIIDLCERSRFAQQKNPLHPIFERLKEDQKKAIQVRDKLYDKFTFVLKQIIKKKEVKLQHYKTKSQDIPLSTKNIDFEAFLKQTVQLKKKCQNLEGPIAKMIHQQKILNLNITDFPDYGELKQNIDFAEKIYQAAKQWESLRNQTANVPFAHVSMKEYETSVNELQNLLSSLKESWKKPSPIMNEIDTSFSQISPFVPQLSQISNGRMQNRHWEMLFEKCGHKGKYTIEITIQFMLEKGILSHADLITDITTTSLGESQLENEFQAISTHWADVTVPFIDPPQNTEDQLLLGELGNLLADIHDTSEKLNAMLVNRFVKGIKTQVFELCQSMDQFTKIFDQWQIFQGNWTTISSLFKQAAVRHALPHQTTRFEVLRKNWIAIVQHALSDNKIFSVCSYPTLLEDFIENNKSLEVILETIPTYLETKREAIPRLYFLSNDEVLTLLSTSDFTVFTQHFVKIMMHIQRFDSHTSDAPDGVSSDQSAREGCNFVGLKVFGVVGEDGDSLPFVNAINCSGPIDYWIPQIFEMMELSTKDALTISLSRFASSSMTEWVMTVSSYIATLTLLISFARDVDDCFNNLEANQRVFLHFEQEMKHHIHDLMSMMSTPLSASEQMKITSVLNLLLNHYERAHALQEKIQSFSHQEAWHNQLKFKYDTNNAEVNIHFGDDVWVRGKEYWGAIPRLVYTPTVDNAIIDLCISKSNSRVPLVFGPTMSGKNKLFEMLNCYFGKFMFVASAFPDIQPYFIEKMFIGASTSGCSLMFKDLCEFSHRNQSIIFDLTRKLTDSRLNGFDKFKIRDFHCDLNPDVRLMFTASEKFDTGVSSQIREYVRPIALSIPNIRKIVESNLISYGFKAAKSLSSALDDLVSVALVTFEMPPIKSKHMLDIIKDAHNILRQIMHNTKVDDIDYYKAPKVAEQYSLSRAAYNHFRVLIDPTQIDLLFILLYDAFHLFGSIDKFSESLVKPFDFYIDKASVILEKVVTEAINNLNLEVPADYLLQQTQSLMEMLLSYPCVIIYGPPHSGKTLIVDLLSQAFGAMISNGELMNQYKGLMPFKVETIYHRSNSFNSIFGTIVNDKLMGNIWRYGSFHSAIAYLNQFSKTHQRILRFDGVITPELNNYIYQFVSNQDLFKLNNLGSFKNDNCFHCIIETDDIAYLTPSLLNSCGLLMMNSVQSIKSDFSFNVDLIHPSIPFSYVQKEFGDKFSDDEYATIRSVFCEMAPVFVRQFGIDFSISVIRFAFNYILTYNIDCKNEDFMMIVVATSFYVCYCSYSSDSHFQFSDWIIKQFKLKIPQIWAEFTLTESCEEEDKKEQINMSKSPNQSSKVSLLSGNSMLSNANKAKKVLPQIFVDYYEKPTLENIRILNNKIAPIETTYLQDRIIVQGSQFADDFIVPNPQHLAANFAFGVAMKPNSHILINGPCDSGKNALLKFIFSKNEEIHPVFFNVSNKHKTIEQIIDRIQKETTLMHKTVTYTAKPKTYALVFNYLSPDNTEVIEFIRKIIADSKIILTSQIDPNHYDIIQLDNFFVIVRSDSIDFDLRFLEHFILVHIEKYTYTTKMYIINRAMGALGISQDMIQLLNYVFEKLDYTMTEMIDSFIVYANIKVNNNDTIKVLMTSIYFNRFNNKETEFENFCNELIEQNQFPIFQEALIHFKNEKVFARAMQNVSSEVLLLDRTKINDFMTKSLKTTVYNESISNFIKIDHSIGRLGHNCIIYSSTASSRMTLLNLVCRFQGSNFIEILTCESVKEFIYKLLQDDGFHVFVLVLRVEALTSLIINVFIDYIFSALFSEDEYNAIVMKMNKITDESKITDLMKLKLSEKLKKLIRWNVRIAFVPDFELNIPDFDVIHLIEPSKHSICVDLIKENTNQLEIVLSSLSEVIEPFLPYSNINQFYDFVLTFVNLMTGDMKNAYAKNEDVKKALDFFEKLSLENTIFTEKLATLLPDLEKLKADSEASRDAFTSKNDAIAMRKLKLSEEKMFLSTELQNKEEELRQADSDRNQLVPNIELALGYVQKLTVADIEPIRITENDPCDSIKLMLEAIAVLIGVPNTSYESFGHALLMDDDFINKIIDNVKYEQITSTTYENLLPYLNNDKLSKKELESVAPILVTFRNFLDALCAYAARNNIFKEKKLAVEMMKRTLNDFIQDMERELDSINDIESLSKQEQKELQQLQIKYVEIQKQYEEIENQKKKIDSILEDDDKLKRIWAQEIAEFSGHGDSMTGDSILMAVYLTYGGMLDSDMRTELLEMTKEKLDESSITTSFHEDDDILSKITSKIISQGSGLPDDVVLPQSALIDFKHMQMTPRIPLLVDPDGIFIAMIQNNQTVIVSMNSTVFNNAVLNAVKEGKLLIITDVDEFAHKLTKIMTLSKSNEETFSLNEKTVPKNPNFKVLFSTSISDVDQIPYELLLRVTVINVSSSSIETIHTSILHQFVNYFDPSLMTKIVDLQKAELAHHVQVNQFELETLNIISYISNRRSKEPKYDYLSDNESIEKLLKSKKLYFEALGTTESADDVKKELEHAMIPFQPLVTIVQTFWICLARYLPKVKSHYRFNFDSIIGIIKSVFTTTRLTDKVITEDLIKTLKNNIIKALLRWIYPMLSTNDSIFFLFLSTFMLKEGNWEDLSIIIQNLSEKVNGKITYEKPLQFDFFEKLKNAEICEFFSLVKGYIASFFGENFDAEFPFFQIDTSIPYSPQTPSFIISKKVNICNGEFDGSYKHQNDQNHTYGNPGYENCYENQCIGPILDVIQYVKSKSKIDSFECISLTEDDYVLDDIKRTIITSMNRGNWVLLNYTIPSKKAAALINDILYLTVAEPVNNTFKLIVNCHTTEYISSHLLSKSKIITIDSFPSIKRQMLEIYQKYASVIRSSTNLKFLKRLFYLGALTYAHLNNRSFISLGFNKFYGLNDSCFEDYIKFVCSFVERYSETSELNVPIRNLRDFAQNLAFGSQIIETQDRRRIRAILSSFFSIASLEDTFTFVDQRLPNSDKWNIPQDGSIAQFTSHISNLPFFNETEVLMLNHMTADPILHWNLSKWLSVPFLSILNEPEDIGIEEEENNEASKDSTPTQNLSSKNSSRNPNSSRNRTSSKKVVHVRKHNYLPESIDLEEKPVTPLTQFWITEINTYNNILDELDEIKNFEKEKPKLVEIYGDKSKFVQFLKEKREFLIIAYKRVAITDVDLKYINDVRGFFDTYRLEYCFNQDISSDKVFTEFDYKKTQSTVFSISGLSIFNGFVSNGILVPLNEEQTKPFSPCPQIFVSFGERSNKSKFFICPLFKTVFPSYEEEEIVDGETTNFVTDICFETQRGDRNWLLNSTSLYINVPIIFK